MIKTKKRLYRLSGDALEVIFVYDKDTDMYFGEYPDFDSTPRYTPDGKKWVNVTKDDCPYADMDFGDCGSCKYFECEKAGDLIGICNNKRFGKKRKDA